MKTKWQLFLLIADNQVMDAGVYDSYDAADYEAWLQKHQQGNDYRSYTVTRWNSSLTDYEAKARVRSRLIKAASND